MGKLSDRQLRILAFLREFMEESGFPPTVRDIQRGCDISSTSVVDYNLRVLEKDGLIRRHPEVSRGIEVLQGRRDKVTKQVPVVGYIAAGEPLPPIASEGWSAPEPLENVPLPADLLGNKDNLFALRVKGMSMIDALIDDGDVVVMEPATEVRDGDMVAAWLVTEKEATLKRIYREGGQIRLQPANSQMKPRYVSPDNLEVQGKVVAILRRLG